MSGTDRDTSGPAFPKPCDECSHSRDWHGDQKCHAVQVGMSIRTWLAGQALAGLCATMRANDFGLYDIDGAAKLARAVADATLAELAK